MANKDELIEKATELGIELKGEETNPELTELIKNKEEADRLAAEELKKESDRVEAEKEKKAEDLRKQREAEKGTPSQERKYTDDDVKAMLKVALAEMRAKGPDGFDDPNNLDDEDPFKVKTVRLPRFQNKFVVGFKNTNTDEYYPDLVIHAFDVWNNEQKRNEPYVTVIFEDKSELNIRLETLITKSQKIPVELVERIEKDTSLSQGKVELAELKDYSRNGTGVYKKLKITQAEYSYKIKLPHSDEMIIVGRDIINW